jgi:hypothetical protein
MAKRLINFFVISTSVLLIVTAVAKIISSTGSAHILQYADPIFGLSFRHMLSIAAILELIIGALGLIGAAGLFAKNPMLRVSLIAWFATGLLLYRVSLVAINYHRPCLCMGYLSDALHIPPQVADNTMKSFLGYMLVGSYAAALWLWTEKRRLATGSSFARPPEDLLLGEHRPLA